MIRIYKESEEFGEYSVFDTKIGSLKEIEPEQYYMLKEKLPPNAIFEGGSNSHTRFPRRIYFQITRKCNLLCPYCFIKANSKEKDLPLSVIKRVVYYLAEMGLLEVRLTGGEPTIHPDFIEIVKNFHANDIYVSVATNGIWSEKIKQYFYSVKNLWIIVSVDGNKEIHNKYRSNSYEQIRYNLLDLHKKNPNIRIRLNTVLTKETVGGIESVFALGKEIAAESITFIPLRPQVRNEDMYNQMLNALEFKEAVSLMIDCKHKYEVNFTTTIEAFYRNEILPDKIFRKHASCAAGREGTNLDYDFTNRTFMLYGCSYSPASDLSADMKIRAPFLAGEFDFDNLDELDRIWQDDDKWKIYRSLQYKSDNCHSCNYYKSKCAGSCPIQNIRYENLDLSEDIMLQLYQQMAKTSEWYCYKNYI